MKTRFVKGRIFPFCFIAFILSLSSCSKNSSLVSPPVVTDTTIEPVESPFGLMVEGVPVTNRLIPIKALAVKDVRAETPVEAYSGNNPYLDSLVQNGYRLNLNFDYYGSSTSAPFVTDLNALTTGISKIIQKYKPWLATVENEETDAVHTGPATDYINELASGQRSITGSYQ